MSQPRSISNGGVLGVAIDAIAAARAALTGSAANEWVSVVTQIRHVTITAATHRF